MVRGEAGARAALGDISQLTLAKAQGGMGLLEATRAQIEARLAKLDAEAKGQAGFAVLGALLILVAIGCGTLCIAGFDRGNLWMAIGGFVGAVGFGLAFALLEERDRKKSKETPR